MKQELHEEKRLVGKGEIAASRVVGRTFAMRW